MQKQKKLLYEVSIIRPLIIGLLVFLHSFNKISEGGGYINDYHLVTSYEWIVYLISGFRIETIALVAGYVFSYQSHDLGRTYEFRPFVWKKFKRLIIPMLFFGLVYYFCFYYHPDTFNFKDFIIRLLSGCGHLWFLPMLFWCFLAIWIIDRFKLSSWWLLIGLAAISIVPTPGLPFGFERLAHFVFYVYGGYFLWTRRDWIYEHCLQWKCIGLLWVLYVLLVVVFHTLMPETTHEMPIMKKLPIIMLQNAMSLFIAIIGIMALYVTVCKYTTAKEYKPKPWIISASDNCYGLYVYHQYILVWLYFFTPLVTNCHPLLVPWIGFLIAYTVSLILTKITLKTKVGQFLIG